MSTIMAGKTRDFHRLVDHASLNRVEIPSEEHEEMNKMAHDVSETLRQVADY